MESKAEIDIAQENINDSPVLYTAVGWVAGTYKPGEKKFEHGALITQDGQTIRATLDWYLRHQLKKKQKEAGSQVDLSQAVYQWKVYPRTQPLRFDLIQMKPLSVKASSRQREQKNQFARLDEFRVVGEIIVISEEKEKVTILIRRNQAPPLGLENSPQYQPLRLRIKGSLPTAVVGQTWELQVRRDGNSLVIAEGHLYEPSVSELACLEKKLHFLSTNTSNSNQSRADIGTKYSGFQHNCNHQTNVNFTELSSSKPLQQQIISETVPTELQRSPLQMKTQPQSALNQTKSRKKSKSQTQPRLDAQEQISNPVTKPDTQKQRFSVKVNGQVFIGCHSVNLSKRMLSIDGKPVAQTKIAIVMGHPKTMKADDGVTQGSNHAILLSR